MRRIRKPDPTAAAANYTPDGLTTAQVEAKRKQFGENAFTREKSKGWKIFLRQFLDPLCFILFFSSGLAFLLREYVDAIVILAIVLINSTLSFIQEFRSEKTVEKLSELIDKQILVIRNKEQMLIDEEELVIGDVVILKGGDIVPADIKIMEANNLSVNESQLTGESVPLSKESQSKNLNNTLLFAGSIIERGHCQGVVYAVGNQTELGKIATLSRDIKKTTPYQKSLAEFSFSLLRIIGVTVVLILVGKSFFMPRVGSIEETILFIVALSMTVVPEALPMVTTITLSNGALQLSKHAVIVKRLSAIEDLGRVNLLCTDKTGTLTKDKLSITEVITEDEELFGKLAFASIEDLKVKNKKYINSFDRAFVRYVSKEIKEQVENWNQLSFLPFDPDARRRRSVVEDPKTKQAYLVVVGSAETLLKLSANKNKEKLMEMIRKSGKEGMRQLAIAYKKVNYTENFDILDQENNLRFLGFANLIDPLRKTAKATVDTARELGVEIKILTGDSLEVARYIGRQIGLVKAGDKVYTGDDLDKMTVPQFNRAIREAAVFARVTPEQKYDIIQELKMDQVVGYQGDGINDAPSLKLAHVGIAVNNATDVSKDSADIILLEDDLEVMVRGLRYGRRIFVNINKYIKHALVGNLGNFWSLAVFYVAFAKNLPMLPIQLLIANLIQDMPVMTIYSDNVDEEEISQPKATSQVKQIMKLSIILGVFSAVYYLMYFMLVGGQATAATRTNLFLFFTFTQLLVIISVRTKRFFWRGEKPSKMLLGAILVFILAATMMTYIPTVAGWMGFEALGLKDLVVLMGAAVIYMVVLDVAKVGLYRVSEKGFS
ncbi:cation-transporting P-type ATPase [Microgenomates group bacterium]|nr:cation-transporting P-type ATPase [Microgenomates group bacterium]